eukprot:Lankesteria_metandrocarpae@DN4011_c0_g1_i1.p1
MSGSEGGAAASNAEPVEEVPIWKLAMLRILSGVATVGRLIRQFAVSTESCVERTVYPCKEDCVSRYDRVMQNWRGDGAKRTDVVHTGGAAEIRGHDSDSSESNGTSDE